MTIQTCFRVIKNPGNAIRHMHGYGDTAIGGYVAFHWRFKHCQSRIPIFALRLLTRIKES